MASHTPQRLRWALGSIGVAVVLLVAFSGWQALKAKDALEIVAADFEQIAAHLRSGDEDAARRTLTSAQHAAAEAEENTDGPGWWLTSRLPGVGDDIEAVRTVADVTDVLASGVLPDIVQASAELDPANLRPQGGRIRIEPLANAAPEVVSADLALQEQTDRVAAIDVAELNGQLAEPVALMQEKLAEAASLSAKASYAVRLLPTMLGSEERRTYLVLFQNNAEVRATGGIPGAWAVMTVADGRISLGRQGSSTQVGPQPEPVLPLTDEEVALYEEKMATFPQNINFTPDFPRTGELAQAMWADALGVEVDGVLSVDPVALSYLLRGTGPIALADGQVLTARTAVPLLLNDIYGQLPDTQRQDAFFAAAAEAVFEKVSAGAGDPERILRALARGAREGRIYAWSDRSEEQSLLAETTLGGAIPRESNPTQPFVGVFLNDGTGAKMQYFLDHRVDVQPASCNREGRQALDVTVTLTSVAPADASQLPDYVVGMARDLGIRPGSQRVNVQLYAPINGWIEESAVDGQEIALSEVDHLGRPVGSRTVEIAPGQSRRLTYTVMSGTGQTGEARLRVTPGVRASGVGTVGPSACSSS